MTPKELLFAHRYPEAVEAYKSHLRQHPDQNYYPGLGDALLCAGRFAEAVSSFKKALEIESNRTKGHMAFLNQIGETLSELEILAPDLSFALDRDTFVMFLTEI